MSDELDAHGYLSRLLVAIHPEIHVLPDLMGVCTQIDHVIAGLRNDLRKVICSYCGDVREYKDRETMLASLAEHLESGDCPKHPMLQAAQWAEISEARLAKAQKWILQHSDEWTGDWACVQCKPNSDMLIEGFACAVCEARKDAAEREKPIEPK